MKLINTDSIERSRTHARDIVYYYFTTEYEYEVSAIEMFNLLASTCKIAQ